MDSIIIDCGECVMRATSACQDCVVTHMFATSFGDDPQAAEACRTGSARADGDAIVFDLAEHRAVRWFAEAGMVPTLRHRAAASP